MGMCSVDITATKLDGTHGSWIRLRLILTLVGLD